jgi:tetratricopeptide (TPR) repeat protein
VSPEQRRGARRAAVHLEAGDFAAAVKDCDAAVERGRELRADFKLIAKALARKGAALAKAGDLYGAEAAYHKSLTEHRRASPPGCANGCRSVHSRHTNIAAHWGTLQGTWSRYTIPH